MVLGISPDNINQLVSDHTGLGETGETVLGAKIGDEVVFVAPTRFDPKATFKDSALPMKNAIQEQNGSGYSVDYRGQAVWAVWRYLPSLKLGMVVKMDVKEINTETEPIKNFSTFLALFTLLLTVGIAARIAKSITKPIESLTITTQSIADGNLQERAKVEEQNEIGVLTDSFNRMAAHLENSYANIHKEMIYVQLLQEVAATANEAQSVESAMQKAMEHICKIIGWPLGHLYLVSGDSQKVIPTNLWHISDPEKYTAFMEITNRTEFTPDIGLPGQILTSGNPEWVRDVRQEDANFPRARDAALGKKMDIGIRTGCAFPVVTKTGIMGILEFFSPETIERDERLLKIMVNMGVQLGHVVERKRTEGEVTWHREQLKVLVAQRTAELKKAHKNEKLILSAIGDGIYGVNMEGCVTFINPAVATMIGYESQDFIGKKQHYILHHRRADGTPYPVEECFIYKAFKDNRVFHVADEVFWRKDGTCFPVEYVSTPIVEDGKVTGAVVAFKDITERKRTEERLLHMEKLSALGKLTSSVAHEFNNPIYGIRNVLEQTSEIPHLKEENKKLLALAVNECNRVADMVRKLRAFYKPSDGIKTWLDIHQTLDDTTLLMKKQLMIKKIQLKKNYAPDLPKVRVVEDQMKQVFLNLLQNAEEAISPEGGNITVTTESPDGDTVKISIKDTGEGIPSENLRLIFDPFFSTRAIKGTGLGLSVCHGIIKSHGGNIQVESQPGEGTVFIISIPIKYSCVCGGDF